MLMVLSSVENIVENKPGFFSFLFLHITPRPAIEYPHSIVIWHFGHWIFFHSISDSLCFTTLFFFTNLPRNAQNTPKIMSVKRPTHIIVDGLFMPYIFLNNQDG